MNANSEDLQPPLSADDFESLCLDLWREIWGDPDAQKNGRSGQEQAGVDVYGKALGRWIGVQCKTKKGRLRSKVSVRELEKEVELAKGFTPKLDSFILATTGPADAKVQKRARELCASAGFEVKVCDWDQIRHDLYQRPELLKRIWQTYWPLRALLGQQKIVGTSRLPRTSGKLFGREQKLADLEATWQDKTTHILSIVAWGGVGKTSLVAQWMAGLAARNFDGADYFDWSFYSQGTRDQNTASADAFVDAALRFFGDEKTADSQQGPWDKGGRLAQLVGQRKTLLVLDGLEPLQHPPGPMAGELKDPAMKALLRGLALRNAGLCVVTTRVPLEDLSSFRERVLREWQLDRLSAEAGVVLLETLKVDGSPAELAVAVEEVGGHALTLNILGRFLVRAHGGDVRKRDRVRLEMADLKVPESHGHAFRAMATYEAWLAAGGKEDHLRQLAILRLLGLFDRPASAKCLAALRAAPAIAGLTENILGLGEEDWSLLVSDLAEAHLVVRDGEALDAHPLIREYFGRRLREKNPEAWRAAHGRLFDHLKDTTDHRPEGLAALQPLYQAVHHGCQAGRHREALDDVYVARILRGTGDDGFYSWRELGAFGANLGAQSCFFESPWSQVVPSLSNDQAAWILNDAAISLRSLGRLREAVEPMRAANLWDVARGSWKNAAIGTGNLSALNLTLGDVAAAVDDAEQSVVFADRSGQALQRMGHRATLADARHQAGDEATALSHFREAERLQAERQPYYPLLYSLQGFQYCELLLAPAELAAGSGKGVAASKAWIGWLCSRWFDDPGKKACAEVERRAARTILIVKRINWLLDVALDHLNLGRARLYRAILNGRASHAAKDAQAEIENAVAGLRAAGSAHHIPRGLLTRAWLRFVTGDEDGARADLDEAQEIAERGSMRLFQADVALYRARFFGDRDALATARRLVEVCGYGRRRAELVMLEERLLGSSLRG